MEPGVSEENERRKAELSRLICYKHLPKLGLKLPGSGYCFECDDYKPVERREHLIYAFLWQTVTLVENDQDKRELLWKNLVKAYSDFNLDGFPFWKDCPEENLKSTLEKFQKFAEDFNSRFNLISMIHSAKTDQTETDCVLLESPRLKLDYENSGKIGDGGFGSVYKVTNKFDGISYALKLIPFGYETEDAYEIIQREIRILAALKPHPNLIAYKTSWLEKFLFKGKFGLSVPPPESGYTNNEPPEASETKETTVTTETTETPKSAESTGECSNPIGSQKKPTVTISVEEVEVLNQLMKSQCTLIDGNICFNARVLSASTDSKSGKNLTFGGSLYILTELCGKNLKTWIEERNERIMKLAKSCGQTTCLLDHIDVTESFNILKQILMGVKAIHDNKVIHRDLKPENILFGLDGKWKIGDFGLATIDQCIDKCKDKSVLPTLLLGKAHTVKFGASAYAAPEQLEKVLDQFDRKVDMFSVGMVTCELFHLFGTFEEKAKAFENLRNNHSLPGEFSASLQTVAKMILQMTSSLPSDRPDAVQILESVLFSEPGHSVGNDLRKEVAILVSKLNQKDAAMRKIVEDSGKVEIVVRKMEEKNGKLEDGAQKMASLISPLTKK